MVQSLTAKAIYDERTALHEGSLNDCEHQVTGGKPHRLTTSNAVTSSSVPNELPSYRFACDMYVGQIVQWRHMTVLYL